MFLLDVCVCVFDVCFAYIRLIEHKGTKKNRQMQMYDKESCRYKREKAFLNYFIDLFA